MKLKFGLLYGTYPLIYSHPWPIDLCDFLNNFFENICIETCYAKSYTYNSTRGTMPGVNTKLDEEDTIHH
jgi:hypothetical protein